MAPPVLFAQAGMFVLFLLLAIAIPVGLWLLLEAETEADKQPQQDWEAAERAARRDTRDDDRR
ncbi:hypothetical protein ACFQH6_17010 [Halobacteriaceae archaeon GCM10025711]